MSKTIWSKTLYKHIWLIFLIGVLIFSYQAFDISQLNDLLRDYVVNFGGSNLIVAILIFCLRFISILIPILPGTYCSVIAGYMFGVESGLLLIFIADFVSCSSSFFLSRKLGRTYLKSLLGERQMQRVERISKNHVEKNFFLMTGLLMTQFFDFVCYAIGLTKVSWKKFMPALIFSICISDLPFVSGGYAIREMGSFRLEQILNGEVQALQGQYLSIFIASVITVFGLAVLNYLISKKINYLIKHK